MAKADMAKRQRPLTVDIPRPGDEQPVWSRIGVIALVGFVVGVAWPRIAGVRIGPSVPGDLKATAETAAAPPSPAAAAPGTAEPEAKPPEPAKDQQQVVVGPGRITRCSDKKNKKVEDCGELQFDPIALPRLKELAQCPAALGVDGKLPIGFELNFEKKEVQVVKGKKTSLPASTVSGILQCAAREFSNVSLEEVPHKYGRYSLVYTATFHPPGAQADGAKAEGAKAEAGGEEQEQAAGTTTSETAVSGLATVSWDTALVRGAPKEGDVVMRLVRGTRVKLVGRQNDWYKVEHRGKTGWMYRGAIGL
ncbi:SH3 domain-containing protein [Sorangium sp. So ce260]|uniref:SH3 domain-containing protein n=1 Tax=Sorangium sp. So ce260 TaxID=3133291 RepID=UPI003F5EF2CF